MFRGPKAFWGEGFNPLLIHCQAKLAVFWLGQWFQVGQRATRIGQFYMFSTPPPQQPHFDYIGSMVQTFSLPEAQKVDEHVLLLAGSASRYELMTLTHLDS